jgi:hypothetical protein
MLAVFSMLYVAPYVSQAQEGPGKLIAQNIREMKFGPTPGFPTCASDAVQSGDPAAGPSILFGRFVTGCVVPWHWHTPNEYLRMVSGVAQVQPKGGKAFTLRQ